MTSPLDQINTQMRARELDGAAEALARLVRKKNAKRVDWQSAANLANAVGDQDVALAALERWRDQNPDDPHRQIAVIKALGAVARHRDAIREARKLQENRRAGGEGYFLEGLYQARFGKSAEALALFRRALAIAPNHTPAWEQIALLQGYDNVDADIRAMELLERTVSQAAHRVPLLYALGRAHDYADNRDAAFRCIDAGARLRQQLSPFTLQPQLDYYDRLRDTFTRDLLDRLQRPEGGERAIFILGAPRSGTTLVEQILATAAAVTPTGEHMFIRVASLALASMEPPDMARATRFDPRRWQHMAQVYLKGIHRRFGVRDRFTDKSLLNHNFAGLIRILFPDARIIWLQRDARDVAWSCFRSRINANQWAQNLDDTVRFLKAQDALCRHWQTVFDGGFLTLSYEDLVTSPESTTERLFNFVGLGRPDDWARFYLASNPVATASLAQVRQPLSAAAVGSWRRYEPFLAPVYTKHGLPRAD